jgi:hypothetical protein
MHQAGRHLAETGKRRNVRNLAPTEMIQCEPHPGLTGSSPHGRSTEGTAKNLIEHNQAPPGPILCARMIARPVRTRRKRSPTLTKRILAEQIHVATATSRVEGNPILKVSFPNAPYLAATKKIRSVRSRVRRGTSRAEQSPSRTATPLVPQSRGQTMLHRISQSPARTAMHPNAGSLILKEMNLPERSPVVKAKTQGVQIPKLPMTIRSG